MFKMKAPIWFRLNASLNKTNLSTKNWIYWLQINTPPSPSPQSKYQPTLLHPQYYSCALCPNAAKMGGGGLDPTSITKSPTKMAQISISPPRMDQITITKWILISLITEKKLLKHQVILVLNDSFQPLLLLFQTSTNHKHTNKNSQITITKTSQNYQFYSGTDHQITNKNS